MRSTVKYLTLGNLIFLVLVFAAGALSGALSEVVYYAAFLLPALLLIILKRDYFSDPLDGVRVKADGLLLSATLAAPTIAVIMVISFATTVVLALLGLEPEQISTEPSFAVSALTLAVTPAIAEELLFRYIPMKLLLPHSGRVCVLLSAVMFSAAHTSFESFPFALFAGVIFMMIDISARSILPSVILHFTNNILSVAFAYFGEQVLFIIGVFVILGLLIAASLAVFLVKKDEIISQIRAVFSSGEPYGRDLVPLAFIIPCIAIAILDFAIRVG